MAWATTVYSPPNLRLSDSAWPILPSACLRGYTRSSLRGQIHIRGPTTKVHQTPTLPYISSQPKLNWFFAVLTWVSIHWFSRAGPAASLRIYYELTHSGEILNFPKMTVPIGLSFFPKENVQFPKACVPTPLLWLWRD